MWECFLNHVYIVFLPAHTSHFLQPLDVAVFRPLKLADLVSIYIKELGFKETLKVQYRLKYAVKKDLNKGVQCCILLYQNSNLFLLF